MSNSPFDARLGKTRSMAAPLYPSSVYALPDLDALDAIMNGAEPGFTYARDLHPNAALLAERLSALEGAKWALLCGSGMGAMAAAILAVAATGDQIVASDRLYGRTTILLTEEFTRLKIGVTFVDTNDLNAVRKALSDRPKLLIVETISNPMLRVADLSALAQLAREHAVAMIVDNTFATPILCRPLAYGATLVMESLGKLIGGHSDITLGMLCGEDALEPRARRVASSWGLAASPFDCWLATRSLATLSLRVHQACRSAQALGDWLAKCSAVRRVIYPGRSDHPDHALAKKMLSGFGNMLCFELAGGRDAVNKFFRATPATPFSPSLGGSCTTFSHPSTTSHRFVEAQLREQMGITDGLVRVSVGLEELSEIKTSIAHGIDALG